MTRLEWLPAIILLVGWFVCSHEIRRERLDLPPWEDVWTEVLRYKWLPDNAWIPGRGVLTPRGWKFWRLRWLFVVLFVAYGVVLSLVNKPHQ
jgi:hypothetical protein